MGHSQFAVYCIDTSSLVALWHWHPIRANSGVWERLDELIEQHRLVAPRIVLEEIHRQDDALLVWARSRKQKLFARTSPEMVRLTKQIVNRFDGLVDKDQPFNSADPFVVALALQEPESRALFGKEVIVVTEEKYAPGRPRIPHVCEAYGLKYLTIHQMFLFEGWSF